MDLGLSGRAALVTAASKGIGFASAQALAADGAAVLICARDVAGIEAAAVRLRGLAAGARIEATAADVAAPDTAARLVELARQHFGRLDVLVTNAGGPPPGTFVQIDEAGWERAFQLTLMSVVRLVREALPLLRASGQGRVVNIASTSVREPIDRLLLSNALRSAVIGLAKTLSRELGPDQITVNNVLPGTILTDRQRELRGAEAAQRGITLEQTIEEAGRNVPLGRIGRPEDVGAVVAFLASGPAGFINGQSITVDGGMLRGIA